MKQLSDLLLFSLVDEVFHAYETARSCELHASFAAPESVTHSSSHTLSVKSVCETAQLQNNAQHLREQEQKTYEKYPDVISTSCCTSTIYAVMFMQSDR
jgi:hypothetical protein